MNIAEICATLSNETRLNILSWLKSPVENFPKKEGCPEAPVDPSGGVCVSRIQEKAGISQSTVSSYLDMMLRAGLLLCERRGKWTYYRRNEDTIRQLASYIGACL